MKQRYKCMKNFTVHTEKKHLKKSLSLFCSPSQLSRLPEISSLEACCDNAVEIKFYILMWLAFLGELETIWWWHNFLFWESQPGFHRSEHCIHVINEEVKQYRFSVYSWGTSEVTLCHESEPFGPGSSASFQFTSLSIYLAHVSSVCQWGCCGRQHWKP